jgi:Mn-dependent DtxR family transcriptional regulator
MADQMIRSASEEARPNSLPAAERAVLLNIETHSNWSASGVVAALCEKGLITRRPGGEFALTDRGRITLEELLQGRRRAAREGFAVRRFRTDRPD